MKAFIIRVLDVNQSGDNYDVQFEASIVGEAVETAFLHINAPWGSDWPSLAIQEIQTRYPSVDGVAYLL